MTTPQICMAIMLVWEFYVSIYRTSIYNRNNSIITLMGTIIGASIRVGAVMAVLHYGGFWR